LTLLVIVGAGLFAVRTVLAVHLIQGGFELEGNAVTNDALHFHDWDQVYTDSLSTPNGTSSGATAISFTDDGPANATIFTGGGSKDPQDVSSWAWKDQQGGLPDKDNLVHSFAARYSLPATGPTGNCPNGTGGSGQPTLDLTIPCQVLYFGSDRFDNSGDAQQGFWFFQNAVSTRWDSNHDGTLDADCPISIGGGTGFCDPDTGLAATHMNGDLLIISDFSNGGTTSSITIYKWNSAVSGNLELLEQLAAAKCGAGDVNDGFCGIVNSANGTPTGGWGFTDKSGNHSYLQGEFYEGGVNLSDLGLGGECFASVASESRSSTSTTATLKDFVVGSFAKCDSGIVTTPKTGAGGDIPAAGLSIGTGSVSVKDSATVTVGGVQVWTGTLKFFLCGPTPLANAYVPCTTGGTAIPNDKTVSNLIPTVLSDVAQLTSVGKYCWRSEFTSGTNGVPDSKDPDSVTNPTATNECFSVNPVTPVIPTEASAGVVLGNPVSDSANLTGTARKPGSPIINGQLGAGAGGSIVFTLYGPSDTAVCTAANLVFTSAAIPVSGDALYLSGNFTPTAAGTYRWIATYTGDSPNTLGNAGTCASANESVVVSPVQPTITTDASADPPTGVPLGTAITDTATLSGATSNAGGSITFKLYGPSDTAVCTAANLVFTSAAFTVNGNGTYGPASFTPTVAGTYRWIASYTGDANNLAASGACADAGEASLVVQLQPTIATAQTMTLRDSATIRLATSGAGNLIGSVRFRLYNNANCSTTAPNALIYDSIVSFPNGIPVAGSGSFPQSVTVNSEVVTFMTTQPVLSWLVEFKSGNAGQKDVTSSCNTENANLTINNGPQ